MAVKPVTEHPAVMHALYAVDSVRRTRFQLTDEQARNVITIEMVPSEMTKLLCLYETHWYHHDNLHGFEGAPRVCGIRIYQVNRLKDGDTWRVLNALGEN